MDDIFSGQLTDRFPDRFPDGFLTDFHRRETGEEKEEKVLRSIWVGYFPAGALGFPWDFRMGFLEGAALTHTRDKMSVFAITSRP